MNWRKHSRLLLAAAAASLLASTCALAQHARTVGGYVVNLGIMPAEVALRADGHRDAHPLHPPAGSEHLLVTLDDQKTGTRVGDAEVVIQVSDPRGHVETKRLLHTQAGGMPDYSELFVFGWSGEYTVRVMITPVAGAKPVEAQFKVRHEI